MAKSAVCKWKWIGATIVVVTVTLSACVQSPPHPKPVIQDKIDRDAHLDGTWTGA